MKNILIFSSNGLLSTNLRFRFKIIIILNILAQKNYDLKFNYFNFDLDNIIKNNNFDVVLNCRLYKYRFM